MSGRQTFCATLILAFLALTVVYPLLDGRIVLLDYGSSGRGSVNEALYGLNGGIAAGVLFNSSIHYICALVGEIGDVVPFLAFFLLAGIGIHRLAKRQRMTTASEVGAQLVFLFNPFVFERLGVGQVGVLLGYACLPFVLQAILEGPLAKGGSRFRAAAWWAGAAVLSVHYLWIVGVVALAVVIQQRLRAKALIWLAVSVATVAVLSAYLVFAQLGQARPVAVTAVDLASYRTQGDPHIGLYGNVLGLYGFWRIGPNLPKQSIHFWPFLLAVLLIVIAIGAVTGVRDTSRRPLAVVLLISGTLGFFLALGDQGLTGPIFRAMYDHLPLFNVMREPQKFSSLLALAYAVFFGWGVQSLVATVDQRVARIAVAVFLVLLPIDYTPTIFNGLDGQIKAVHVPASYEQANRLLGKGPGEVLALPWHQYLSFPFTGRVIANPVPTLFDRNVIAGDDVELPGVATTSTSRRSAFLEFVYAHGSETQRFGSLVAPLGIQFVVLSKTVDWLNYGWLDHQRDLTKILDTSDLAVYRNTEPVDLGHRVTSTVTLPDWGALVALSNTTDLTSTAVTVAHAAPGPVTVPSPPPALLPTGGAAEGARRRVRVASPVRLHVPAGDEGLVAVAEPYDAAWRAAGRPPLELAQGGMAFSVGPGATDIHFTHWPLTLLGYGITGLAIVVLAGSAVVTRRRRTSGEITQTKLGAGMVPATS